MTTTGIDPGQMRFTDNYVPRLPPGDYNIQVTQALEADGIPSDSGDPTKPPFSASQAFTVAAPRFQLPPQDVHREFPPPNSQGRFAQNLPHIVLTKRSLPWERNIFGDSSVPWMALLLLDESEIMPPDSGSVSSTGAQTVTVGEFLNPSDAGIAPPVQMDPPVPQQMEAASCQVVQLSTDTFQLVVPSQDNLPYLAHCRLADLSRKAIPDDASPASPALAGLHFYSVVMGARFPQAPPTGGAPATVNVAHLVSLEGFENYVRANQSDGPVAFPSGTGSVRLVSLASWTFTALQNTGQSFAQLMQATCSRNSSRPGRLCTYRSVGC